MILDYLRAIKENKALFASYALFAFSLATFDGEKHSKMLAAESMMVSGYLFSVTLGGMKTLSSLRSARRYIGDTGTLDRSFQNNFQSYCEATGIVAAAKAEKMTSMLTERTMRRTRLPIRHYAPGLFTTSGIAAAAIYYTLK